MASWDHNERRTTGHWPAVILILLFVLALGIAGRMDKEDAIRAQVTPAHTHFRCEEDMPCWDCKTMGNHICGP